MKRYFDENNKLICLITLDEKNLNNIQFNNNELSLKKIEWDINPTSWVFKYVNKHLKLNQKSKLPKFEKQPKIKKSKLKELTRLDLNNNQKKKFPSDSISSF